MPRNNARPLPKTMSSAVPVSKVGSTSLSNAIPVESVPVCMPKKVTMCSSGAFS